MASNFLTLTEQHKTLICAFLDLYYDLLKTRPSREEIEGNYEIETGTCFKKTLDFKEFSISIFKKINWQDNYACNFTHRSFLRATHANGELLFYINIDLYSLKQVKEIIISFKKYFVRNRISTASSSASSAPVSIPLEKDIY